MGPRVSEPDTVSWVAGVTAPSRGALGGRSVNLRPCFLIFEMGTVGCEGQLSSQGKHLALGVGPKSGALASPGEAESETRHCWGWEQGTV